MISTSRKVLPVSLHHRRQEGQRRQHSTMMRGKDSRKISSSHTGNFLASPIVGSLHDEIRRAFRAIAREASPQETGSLCISHAPIISKNAPPPPALLSARTSLSSRLPSTEAKETSLEGRGLRKKDLWVTVLFGVSAV